LEIATQSGALYDKFVGFVEDLKDIGVKLRQTQDSYDAAHNKLTSGKGNLISRAERVLRLGAKASKRLPLNLVESALEDEEIGTTEQIDELTRSLVLDDGGLFPDLVAGEADPADEESLPLLNAKIAGAQGGER
jgi:DNA anti-recombination protein RmuC